MVMMKIDGGDDYNAMTNDANDAHGGCLQNKSIQSITSHGNESPPTSHQHHIKMGGCATLYAAMPSSICQGRRLVSLSFASLFSGRKRSEVNCAALGV